MPLKATGSAEGKGRDEKEAREHGEGEAKQSLLRPTQCHK
jgi:hypothetical protein